jgi:serine/threonine protein phosphatase PrpC
MAAALADGVSGGKAGRVAAELAVRAMIEGYYAQPDTIGVAAAVDRVMAPFNRWLTAMGRGDGMAHSATTFTGLVIRGRKAHVLHVGDSRAWHLRGDRLAQITTDHTHSHPDRRHILLRALGLEEHLRLDHHELALAEHDRLLLTSDGVHGVLGAPTCRSAGSAALRPGRCRGDCRGGAERWRAGQCNRFGDRCGQPARAGSRCHCR